MSGASRIGEAVVQGWAWSDNRAALLRSLADVAEYRIDDLDEDAIEAGLVGTDAEHPYGWFNYPLAGRIALDLNLAYDRGTDVLSVLVGHPADPILGVRIETILDLLSSFRVVE